MSRTKPPTRPSRPPYRRGKAGAAQGRQARKRVKAKWVNPVTQT